MRKLLFAKARNVFMALPKEMQIGMAVVLAVLVPAVLIIAVSSFEAFIHPAAAYAEPYGLGEESDDALAYYCRHLALTGVTAGAKLPVTCQAPEMLASAMAPFVLAAHYDGDQYAWGNCTYWAALRRAQTGRPVPNTWGDAYLWAARAASDGYTVDHMPAPGAIMQTSRGVGHVAYVEGVNADGSWRISEMNAIGFNKVDYRTLPAAAAASYYFIH
jgi:surface antigen